MNYDSTLHIYSPGLEEVRVLVRGNLLRAVWGVRAGVQPDLGADPHLAGDEETHLQPAARGPHYLRDAVSFCTLSDHFQMMLQASYILY